MRQGLRRAIAVQQQRHYSYASILSERIKTVELADRRANKLREQDAQNDTPYEIKSPEYSEEFINAVKQRMAGRKHCK